MGPPVDGAGARVGVSSLLPPKIYLFTFISCYVKKYTFPGGKPANFAEVQG